MQKSREEAYWYHTPADFLANLTGYLPRRFGRFGGLKCHSFLGAHVLCSSAVGYYAFKNVPYGMLGGGSTVVAARIRVVES